MTELRPIHQDLMQGTYRNNIPDQKIYDLQEKSDAQRRIDALTCLGVTDINNTFSGMKLQKGFELTLKAFEGMASGNADFNLLMVYGVTGNGKSRGCQAVVIDMFDRGIRVKRDRWSDVVRTLKSLFNGNNHSEVTYDQYFSGLRNRQRLILDDIGSGSTLGAWEWGELEDIIDYRYEHSLFTIVTTNLDIKQFPERILSRFKDHSKARLVYNEAPDYRPQKK